MMVYVYAHARTRHVSCTKERRECAHAIPFRGMGTRDGREGDDVVVSYHEIENDTHCPYISCTRVICTHFAHCIAAVDELDVRFSIAGGSCRTRSIGGARERITRTDEFTHSMYCTHTHAHVSCLVLVPSSTCIYLPQCRKHDTGWRALLEIASIFLSLSLSLSRTSGAM